MKCMLDTQEKEIILRNEEWIKVADAKIKEYYEKIEEEMEGIDSLRDQNREILGRE